jgi:hypothetical protein
MVAVILVESTNVNGIVLDPILTEVTPSKCSPRIVIVIPSCPRLGLKMVIRGVNGTHDGNQLKKLFLRSRRIIIQYSGIKSNIFAANHVSNIKEFLFRCNRSKTIFKA